MKTEVLKTFDGGATVTFSLSPAEMEITGKNFLAAAVEFAARELARTLVEDRGSEIIKMIPLETILNRVIAEAVVKIGAAQQEPRR